jgi:hypothetical protein
VNLVLMWPVITAAPGFLVNAAANPLRVGLSVVLGLGTGAGMYLSFATASSVQLSRGPADQCSPGDRCHEPPPVFRACAGPAA